MLVEIDAQTQHKQGTGIRESTVKVLFGFDRSACGRDRMVGRYLAYGCKARLKAGDLLLEEMKGPFWRLGVVNPAGHVDWWHGGWTTNLGLVLHTVEMSFDPEKR